MPDVARLKISALRALCRQQRIGKQVAGASAKPDVERDAESLFAAIEKIPGKYLRGHLFEDVLPAAILDLERGWKRRREGQHLVVEKRYARLDRMGHAHTIDFRQHVLGQIRFRVEAHHLRDPGKVRVPVEMAAQARLRIGRGERC